MRGIDKVSQWVITCDCCGETEEVIWGDSGVFNQSQAVKEFRERGWIIGKKIICKRCGKPTQLTGESKQGEKCPECKQFIGTNTMCSDCARFREPSPSTVLKTEGRNNEKNKIS